MEATQASSGGMSARAGKLVVKAARIDKAKMDFEGVMVTYHCLGRGPGWS
jgi:hypothetical protein